MNAVLWCSYFDQVTRQSKKIGVTIIFRRHTLIQFQKGILSQRILALLASLTDPSCSSRSVMGRPPKATHKANILSHASFVKFLSQTRLLELFNRASDASDVAVDIYARGIQLNVSKKVLSGKNIGTTFHRVA